MGKERQGPQERRAREEKVGVLPRPCPIVPTPIVAPPVEVAMIVIHLLIVSPVEFGGSSMRGAIETVQVCSALGSVILMLTHGTTLN